MSGRGGVRSSARLSGDAVAAAATGAPAAPGPTVRVPLGRGRPVATTAAAALRRARAAERAREVEDSPRVLRDKCRRLARALRNAKHLVVYTGAGISTAADIPDYRGPDGVWTRLQRGETVGRVEVSRAKPTFTHMALTALWARGALKFVVSQNCDGLHLRSGLPRRALAELHGDMFAELCGSCRRVYLRAFDTTERTARHQHGTRRLCHACGAELRDSIVHFGERGRAAWPLNWAGALRHAARADVVLCLGSSLKVLRRYPRLWRMQSAPRSRPALYIVNLQWTPKDSVAALKINAKCDAVMQQVARRLRLRVPRYRAGRDPVLAHAEPLSAPELHTTRRPLLRVPDEADDSASDEWEPSSPSASDSDEELPLRHLADRLRAPSPNRLNGPTVERRRMLVPDRLRGSGLEHPTSNCFRKPERLRAPVPDRPLGIGPNRPCGPTSERLRGPIPHYLNGPVGGRLHGPVHNRLRRPVPDLLRPDSERLRGIARDRLRQLAPKQLRASLEAHRPPMSKGNVTDELHVPASVIPDSTTSKKLHHPTPGDIEVSTPKKIHCQTPDCFRGSTPEKIQLPTPGGGCSFTPEKRHCLTPNNLRKLTPEKLGRPTSDSLNDFTPRKHPRTVDYLHGSSTEKLNRPSPDICPSSSTLEKLDHPTTENLCEVVTSEKLPRLTPDSLRDTFSEKQQPPISDYRPGSTPEKLENPTSHNFCNTTSEKLHQPDNESGSTHEKLDCKTVENRHDSTCEKVAQTTDDLRDSPRKKLHCPTLERRLASTPGKLDNFKPDDRREPICNIRHRLSHDQQGSTPDKLHHSLSHSRRRSTPGKLDYHTLDDKKLHRVTTDRRRRSTPDKFHYSTLDGIRSSTTDKLNSSIPIGLDGSNTENLQRSKPEVERDPSTKKIQPSSHGSTEGLTADSLYGSTPISLHGPAPDPLQRITSDRLNSLASDRLRAFKVTLHSGEVTILLRAEHAPSPLPGPSPPRCRTTDLRRFRMTRHGPESRPPSSESRPLIVNGRNAGPDDSRISPVSLPEDAKPSPVNGTAGLGSRLRRLLEYEPRIDASDNPKRLSTVCSPRPLFETNINIKTELKVEPKLEPKTEFKDGLKREASSSDDERGALAAGSLAAAIIRRAVLLCRASLYPGLHTIIAPPAPISRPAPTNNLVGAECAWCARHYSARRCLWYGPPRDPPPSARAWRRVRGRRYLCACCGAGQSPPRQPETGPDEGGWYGKGYRKGRRRRR